MKQIKMKTLAAAVLGTAIVAMPVLAQAQSSVTLYGLIDMGLKKTPGATTQVAPGFWDSLGMRGTEDLGGGLSAFFHFEARYNADTGMLIVPNQLFNKRSLVGLKGSFGSIYLGRFDNALDDITSLAEPFADATVGNTREAVGAETKWENSIGYTTPTVGGLNATFTTATKELPNTTVPFAFNVKYATGPAVVALAYVKNGGTSLVNPRAKSFGMVATYDFGPFKLHSGFTLSDDMGVAADHKGRYGQVGVNVPYGSGAFKASVSHNKDDTSLPDRLNKYAVGYWYDLSKNTLIYTDIARLDKKLNGLDDSGTAMDFGIAHKF